MKTMEMETRPCSICGRETMHDVAKSGVGDERASCREHRTWSNGRIDARDAATGEWRMIREAR
jgi:hypothetical protein